MASEQSSQARMGVRKARARTRELLGKVLAASVVILCVACHSDKNHPTDETVANLFREHKIECEKLVAMVTEDDLLAVTHDEIRTRNGATVSQPPRGQPQERWRQYRRLMNTLSLDGGVMVLSIGSSPRMVLLRLSVDSNGGEKGLLFTDTAPDVLLDSLDDWSGHSPAHKKLVDNWYIYLTLE